MDKQASQGFLARLNPRERKLLTLWAVAMSFMVFFLGGWFAWSSITEKADAAEQYQLTLILSRASNRISWRARVKKKKPTSMIASKQ